MQDKYTGDIGDFGKYLLLNELSRLTNGTLKLGINWYYTSGAAENNNDGRHIHYLNSTNPGIDRFRECSPELYQKLKMIVEKNQRRIAKVENIRILPAGTIFYSVPVPTTGDSLNRCGARREVWFQNSYKTLHNADIIFLDPDNGIQTCHLKKTQNRAFKYTFIDEIEGYYRSGKSLIVYNHRDRTPKHLYDQKFLNLRSAIGNGADLRILRFKRVSVRDYVFIAQKYHEKLFDELVRRLTKQPLNFLFESYEL